MSLTPESLALKVGKWAQGRKVIDAGCGVGGNAIGFARAGSQVVAIELDGGRARMATMNAQAYGVQDKLHVQRGDALDWATELARETDAGETILFCDPPWGAQWNRERCEFDDFPLLKGLLGLREHFFELWAKLPASFATETCPAETWGGAQAQAVFGDAGGDKQRVKFVILRG